MLNSTYLQKLIKENDLISGYIDMDKQLQPAGFDLSLGEIHTFEGIGTVDFTNQERQLAPTKILNPDKDGWFNLQQGCYIVVYNEAVKIPLDVVALARSRSTILRNGASVGTAVWDPGYQGRSSSLLTIHNPNGIKLKQNARITQLIFFKINQVEKGYSGVYQNERIK